MNTGNILTSGLQLFVKAQEGTDGLSHIRCVQDTVTNWLPAAIGARSKAELAEKSVLEFPESGLFYYAPTVLGGTILRPMFNKVLPEGSPALKASIILSCTAIPAAEYALSFAKNLFTLQMFKKTDFASVVNLDKSGEKNQEKQDEVKESAIKHIKGAAIAAGVGLTAGLALLFAGKKSKSLQKLSEGIISPGGKLSGFLKKRGVKSEGLHNFLNTYLNFDFNVNAKGQYTLGKGQLAATVATGVFGYINAARDRDKSAGKNNNNLETLEVLSRIPLTAAYTVFGSSLLEHHFKKFLKNKKGYKELIDDKLNVLPLDALKAKNLPDGEYKKLLNKKAVISGVPFVFALGVMGFFVTAMSRFWTAQRYKQTNQTDKVDFNQDSGKKNLLFSRYKNLPLKLKFRELLYCHKSWYNP